MNSNRLGNDEKIISRVTSITLGNFRGFKKEIKCNTDADLVLLSGPNGYGKSSFLEGLLLLLTGWTHRATDQLVSHKNNSTTDGNIISWVCSSLKYPLHIVVEIFIQGIQV